MTPNRCYSTRSKANLQNVAKPRQRVCAENVVSTKEMLVIHSKSSEFTKKWINFHEEKFDILTTSQSKN